MRCLFVGESHARAQTYAGILQREGYPTDALVHGDGPLVVALDHVIVFVDLRLGVEKVIATIRPLAALVRPVPPLAALIGDPAAADVDALVAAGAHMYFVDEPEIFGRRVRFLRGAIASRSRAASVLAALRESQEQTRALIDAAGEGLVVQNRDGSVVTHNREVLRIFALSPEQIAAGLWQGPGWKLTSRDGKPAAEHELPHARSLASGEAVRDFCLGCVRPDGELVWVIVNATPILDASGAPTAVVSTFRDITEQRKLETQLVAADRLAAVGRLAAGVGHEINNPLTYVIGNVRVAMDRLEEAGAPPETLEILSEALEGADRIRHIVRDLKVFATRRRDDLSPVEVVPLLDSCVRMAMNEIRHRARLLREVEAVPPVRGNEARLAQVLLNLLMNAAQALDERAAEHNVITLSTHVERDGRVAIRVRDTGAGIPPELLVHVFEPFYTTKGETGGTGLGLSICRTLVTSMGGELSLESDGRGTVATVRLIAEDGAVPSSWTSLEPASHTRSTTRRRVLIIDDEPRIADLLREGLSEHDVEVASSGRVALELLGERASFDVIVCDVMMPEVTGPDVYEHLRKVQPGMEHRMVFITGGAFTPRAVGFLGEIDNVRLEKPFAIRDLLDAVETAAGRGDGGSQSSATAD